MWKFRQRLATFFLALLTLTFTLVVPVLFSEKVTGTEREIKPTSFLISQVSNALNLEQQGKKYYDIGNFSEAAKIWQQAADAYGKDEDGKNRNLINKAKALQSLGLYPEACSQIVAVFDIVGLKCEQLNNNQNIQDKIIQVQPNSLNKIIGLRLLGETLQKLGNLEASQRLLNISFKAADKYPEERSALLLSLGNIERAIGNKERDRLEYHNILNILEDYQIPGALSQYTNKLQPYKSNCNFFDLEIDNISKNIENYRKQNENSNLDHLEHYKSILKTYNLACNSYDNAKNQASLLTQMQAEVNQFSLLVEVKEWWNEQIQTHKDLLNRQQATLEKQIEPQKYSLEIICQERNNSDLEKPPLIKRLCRIKKDFKNIENQENNLHNQIDVEITNTVLPKVIALFEKLPNNREVVYAQINFANNLIRFYSITQEEASLKQPISKLSEAAKILSKAIQQARNLGDKQAESQGLSNLARLYELQASRLGNLTKQYKLNLAQAKKITEQALSLLDDINLDNREILYRQRHQLGRILRASGNIEGALASYAEAWNVLQSLRADLVNSADNQFSFRQNVEPIYRDFIDLLLQPKSRSLNLENLVLLKNLPGEDNQTESKTLKDSLDIARLIMESLQLAELDNFLQRPCSPPITKPVQINDINKDTAVIYPIILADRLEVILSLPGKTSSNKPILINHKVVKNHLEDLSNIIYSKVVEPESAFQIVTTTYPDQSEKISDLKNNEEKIQKLSKTVYDWLIKPLESALAEQKIKTLVFVLDRPFQKIPLAAIYDGEKYLIEKYNIALNVGQQLINPKSLKRENLKILAAGVSKERQERGQPFFALPGVKAELDSINNLGVPTEIILDESFTKEKFQAKIKKFSPNIVHLSTHGIFSSNREQTFLLTGDSSIGIDDFQNLLNPQDRISRKTLELLFLSACETASGDEKAALGMAGVVLRSGASSTVATLWPVSDNATATLGLKFYENLITGKVSRAEALHNAQLSLLHDSQYKQYKHPFYWAAFILMGNWL